MARLTLGLTRRMAVALLGTATLVSLQGCLVPAIAYDSQMEWSRQRCDELPAWQDRQQCQARLRQAGDRAQADRREFEHNAPAPEPRQDDLCIRRSTSEKPLCPNM